MGNGINRNSSCKKRSINNEMSESNSNVGSPKSYYTTESEYQEKKDKQKESDSHYKDRRQTIERIANRESGIKNESFIKNESIAGNEHEQKVQKILADEISRFYAESPNEGNPTRKKAASCKNAHDPKSKAIKNTPIVKTYQYVSVGDWVAKYGTNNISALFSEVLRLEAPVNLDFFLRRACRAYYGQVKVTPHVRARFMNDIGGGFNRFKASKSNGFVYLNDQNNFVFRRPSKYGLKRDPEDISLEELAAGMWYLISINTAIHKEDLLFKMRDLCGFDRMGEKMRNRFYEALDLCEKTYDFQMRPDGYILMNNK